MKIVTLIENKESDIKNLDTEHGLSIYLEADEKSFLFDTGQSGAFVDNAKKLNIDLKNLDYTIISHGHYDHSGGFKRLIEEINPKTKLYVGNGFFDKKYSLKGEKEYEYTGNPFTENFLEENNISTEYINEDIVNITDNVLVFTNFNRDKDFENTNEDMYIKKDQKYKKDMFLDEIAIAIKTDKGLVVIVGCSHVGIINILDTIIQRTNMNIYALIGGTHLVREDDEKINRIIEYLKDKDIKLIGACHCTGKHGETMLSQQLEGIFINNNTGDMLEI